MKLPKLFPRAVAVLLAFAIPAFGQVPRNDRLLQSELKQQQIQRTTQRVGDQLSGIIGEFERNGIAGEDVKVELKGNTDAAIVRGVFGVPTCAVDGKLFWGLDALPMLRAYLEGDAWFSGGDWDAVAQLPGQQRAR